MNAKSAYTDGLNNGAFERMELACSLAWFASVVGHDDRLKVGLVSGDVVMKLEFLEGPIGSIRSYTATQAGDRAVTSYDER
jgi:hypothetical protein